MLNKLNIIFGRDFLEVELLLPAGKSICLAHNVWCGGKASKQSQQCVVLIEIKSSCAHPSKLMLMS